VEFGKMKERDMICLKASIYSSWKNRYRLDGSGSRGYADHIYQSSFAGYFHQTIRNIVAS
jgi:hypothetical protein